MYISQNFKVSGESDPKGENKRRHGRLLVSGVGSNYGDVLDISASGMRLCHTGKLGVKVGDKVQLTLDPEHADEFTVRVLIAWISPGDKIHEIGVEFVSQTEEQRARVLDLVRLRQHAA